MFGLIEVATLTNRTTPTLTLHLFALRLHDSDFVGKRIRFELVATDVTD